MIETIPKLKIYTNEDDNKSNNGSQLRKVQFDTNITEIIENSVHDNNRPITPLSIKHSGETIDTIDTTKSTFLTKLKQIKPNLQNVNTGTDNEDENNVGTSIVNNNTENSIIHPTNMIPKNKVSNISSYKNTSKNIEYNNSIESIKKEIQSLKSIMYKILELVSSEKEHVSLDVK